MQALFQSAFLQALGYSIANSLWQMAFLWLLYVVISAVLKPAASHKYILAVSLETIGFIWFIVTLQFYYSQYSRLLYIESTGLDSEAIATLVPQGQGFRSLIIEWMIRIEQLLPYLSVAYLLLMLILCVRWIMGYRYTQLIRKEGLLKIPAEWRIFVKTTAQQLGIQREVGIFLSEKVRSPLTIGFLKPLVLIPVASINHLTVSQLEAVLLHEIAHIKRYDYLVNILLSVTEIALFFNPFTQLLSRQIKKERENSCDDWVLQFQYSATIYAEALLRIAQLQTTPTLALAAQGSNENELLNRVKRMIGAKEQGFHYRKQLLAFLLVTGILSSIAWLNPDHQSKQKENTPGTVTNDQQKDSLVDIQPVTVEPMAVKVTNPLFNPAFFLSGTLKEEMQENLKKATDEMNASLQSKEVQEAMRSIPVVLNDAYKTLRADLFRNTADWKEELAGLEKAKVEMKSAMRSLDTLSIPSAERLKIKDDMELSLKKMELDFSEAQEALSKLSKTTIPFKKEQEMVSKEIERAIQEVQKLQLDKNISQVVPLVDILKAIEKLDIKISKDEKADKVKQKKTEKLALEKLKKQKAEETTIEEEETYLPLIPINFQETNDVEKLFNKWLLSQLLETKDSTLLEQDLLMNADSSFRGRWDKLKQKLYQEKRKIRI
ncbi:M56 family metallopeptidase [Sediminibacterium goheungense]|uniref:BlaR1 peptidase M56 n=1 Tax=Sediminibacterium goheungense TaxID=1086393 RepID=A0A4R6IP13_9BACT|nr:M56 family metallopeptidase [Sediminibacterium goheungense]TDO23665.1 BlaR1 peptidase M56 [Sediminibacterium goheungense]